jgi:hypothetical protein
MRPEVLDRTTADRQCAREWKVLQVEARKELCREGRQPIINAQYRRTYRKVLLFKRIVPVFPLKTLVGRPEWRDDKNCYDPTRPWWRVIGPAIS